MKTPAPLTMITTTEPPPAAKTGAAMNRGTSKQDFATPPNFREAVCRRFGFPSVDLAAHAGNYFGKGFIGPAENSLLVPWAVENPITDEPLFWLNPPFANIAPWAKKCAEVNATTGARILFLTPASVGSEWFDRYVHRKAMVLGLVGRIAFDPLHPSWGYPKDCILSCYGYGVGFDTWDWRD